MSKVMFGTNAVTGLNVGRAKHLIADHELTVDLNGWTDQEGSWTTAPGPEVLYTGYSSISCFASGRMGGEDHAVWMDGNTLYDNGSSAGTITAGDSMSIQAIDDGFLILGASVPYLYDGNHVRELGTLQYDNMALTGISLPTAASDGITGITRASSAVVTTTNSIFAAVGEYVYITGVVGMTEINGSAYEVTAVSGTGPYSYTLAVDSSNWTAYTSGGTAYGGVAAISGDYKFYMVPTIELLDGTMLLGRARGLKVNGYFQTYGPDDSWDADTVTLEYTDAINIKASLYWNYGGSQVWDIDGTKGTDYTPGLRLYRTKADGTDFYLEKEWQHGDSDLTTNTNTYVISTYSGGVPDGELGAVYSADAGDHNNPPAASIATTTGQRMYLADGKKVYWSHLDGIEYWNDLDYVTMPDTVTALASVRDKTVIFSADRIWVMDMYSGVPEIREIDTPVGTTYSDAMVTVDAGLLFLRTDGLWLFNGSAVDCISRRAFTYLSAPKSICATGDTIYMSGEAYSYVVRVRDGGWIWHGGDGTYEIADATGGSIYAASTTSVSKLFEGGPNGGYLTTKLFGGFDETKQYRVLLDVEGESRPTVSINGVRQDDVVAHSEAFPVTSTGRRIIRLPVPRLMNPYFLMTIATSGDLTVHGYVVEACR